ncbi:MAG: ABC transporter permease subunit [Cyanobacteriota bacterium]|nr:ABC transporter permease subunit [Cyanobacteriota bacterium]
MSTDSPSRRSPVIPPRRAIDLERSLWSIGFLVALIWCVFQTGIGQREWLNLGGLPQIREFLGAALHPNLSRDFVQLTASATLKTLAYAVCGTTFSLILGCAGGILSSEIWWKSHQPQPQAGTLKTWLAIRGILSIPRAIHEMVWGLFFVHIFGLDPIVGIIAIALPFGAITAKVFSEILDETPREPLYALLNAGVSPAQAFLYSLIPQALPGLLSYAFYRFECSIRSAAVLGIIGAGGLGYQLNLSLKSLRYEQMWTLLWALVLLSGVVDFWSARVRHGIGAPSRLALNIGNIGKLERRSTSASASILHSGWIVVLLVPVSFSLVGADFGKLWQPRTYVLLAGILQDAFPPDWSEVSTLLPLCAQTLAMSVLAMVGAGLGGLLLSFPAAIDPNSGRGKSAIVVLLRCLFLATRAIPAPIWALILLYVLLPGILPGAIALGLYNFGILGRLMAEAIENLDLRPARALAALGATEAQVFLYGILPTVLPGFLAYILYRWEVCIRATAIVGLVGAGGLGRTLAEQLSSFDYPGVVTTLLGFAGLTLGVDWVSGRVRRSLR